MFAFDFPQFCNDYGNAASVLGLLVSVFGLLVSLIAFPLTWWRQRQIRRAVGREATRLAFVVLGNQANELDRLLETLKEACRMREWLRAFDRCRDARSLMSRVIGSPRLSEEEKVVLRTGLEDLLLIERYLKKQKLKTDPSDAFHEPKEQALDRLIDALGAIRSRIEQQTWESRDVD